MGRFMALYRWENTMGQPVRLTRINIGSPQCGSPQWKENLDVSESLILCT